MNWPFIFTAISAVMFFGFVIFCVWKFGLLDCYSAYAIKWRKLSPIKGINTWSVVTVLSAAILLPALIELGKDSAWQFTAFLCPALIIFVGFTPDYRENKMALRLHMICANGGALFAVLYILLVQTQLWWLIVLYLILAGIKTLIYGKWSWCFWFEMAAYLLIYTAMFAMTI